MRIQHPYSLRLSVQFHWPSSFGCDFWCYRSAQVPGSWGRVWTLGLGLVSFQLWADRDRLA
jgi:hypothetical protein